MPRRHAGRLLPAAAAAMLAGHALAGCARLPAAAAVATPAAPVAAGGMASLTDEEGGLLGAATAVGPALLVTNAHVIGSRERLRVQRGDGGAILGAAVARRLPGIDLVLLRVEAPLFDTPPCLADPPRPGQPVWSVGVPGIGPVVASGPVQRPSARLEGFGTGFTIRMPALMGHSGGPVVDADGCLLGVTTALLSPGAAALLAVLSGVDLDGLARREAREVFAIGLPQLAELVAGP
jgi:S1-C subfamily serine protease